MNKATQVTSGGAVRAAIGGLIRKGLASIGWRRKICEVVDPPTTTENQGPSPVPQRPSEPIVISLRLRPLADIIRDASNGSEPIATMVSYPRETVALAPLRNGSETLSRVAVRENEQHISWQQTSYLSLPTSAHVIMNALVHGAAGLIGIGDEVVTETTWHTEPCRHRYQIENASIRIEVDDVPYLSGTHLSLLTPGGINYWHALIDGVAKLSIIPDTRMGAIQTILFSADAIGQETLLGLSGLPRSIVLRPVQSWETLRIETLVLPWDLHGVFDYHPCINRFFDAIIKHHSVAGNHRIERLYVDRRGSSQRKLLNEDDVVVALEDLGFVPVRLENLTIEQQIALFRQAAIIVSPHGAGLTNIGFSPPGCVVIELMMDAYLNWCFRRIAALRNLHYDCVIGTAHRPWKDLNPGFHSQVWEIDVGDVVDTVNRSIRILDRI